MVKLGALQRIRFHFIVYQISTSYLILRRLKLLSIVWLSNGGVLYLFVLLTQIYLVFFIVCINTEWVFGDEREAYYDGGGGGGVVVMTASYVIYTNTQRIATYQVSLSIYQLNQMVVCHVNFLLGERWCLLSTVSCCLEMSMVATQQLKMRIKGNFLGDGKNWYDNQPPREREPNNNHIWYRQGSEERHTMYTAQYIHHVYQLLLNNTPLHPTILQDLQNCLCQGIVRDLSRDCVYT